ncbi:MAG: S41 family peptidase [Candidatus Eremiobacteraeota bacterium]|nr:S41 family peptidase [Candidatus Eremiobacteraeota bacterium]MBV9645973.1 S41 family peptidase [Candidatus Eremiobacteraeota bacterium]
MPAAFRALIAALVVALASLGGALYLGHERTIQGIGLFDGQGGLATLDLQSLLDRTRNSDEALLSTAFRKVEETYYKPVTAQLLMDGEQRELIATLKRHQVHSPRIPAAVANGNQRHDIALLSRNLDIAESSYRGVVGDAELTQAAIRGMLNALGDPYTTYLSPAEISSLEESLRGGDFGGIGVYIVQDPRTKRVIVDPIEGTPAYRAGIKPGDTILAVNGQAVRGMQLDDVEHAIRGKVGTIVTLLVLSHTGGGAHSVVVTREQIIVPSVHAKMENGFDYVRLADFGSTSYDEVRRALASGKEQHARGYILDLRNNGGGLLDAAVQISSLFVPQGAIVSTIDRNNVRETKSATHDAMDVGPLVILVNRYTASASEITAGAIQDYRVGTLVGTKTFGKGVVQSIYNMSDGGALKITTARYLTPLGRDIQHRGIEPDLVVNQSPDPSIIDSPKDLQLAAAQAYLRRIAHR